MTSKEYLTDEALDYLVQQIESEGEIEAPAYLFEQIMDLVKKEKQDTASEEKIADRPDVNVQMLRPPRAGDARRRKREFRIYCAKVLATAAAAIVLMFAVPHVNNTYSNEAEIIQSKKQSTIIDVLFQQRETEMKKLTGQPRETHYISDFLTGNYLTNALNTQKDNDSGR